MRAENARVAELHRREVEDKVMREEQHRMVSRGCCCSTAANRVMPWLAACTASSWHVQREPAAGPAIRAPHHQPHNPELTQTPLTTNPTTGSGAVGDGPARGTCAARG